MKVDLQERDQEFCEKATEFLVTLKQIKEINGFPRAWVPENHYLAGFVISLDGGKPGFGTLGHSLAIRKQEVRAVEEEEIITESKQITRRPVKSRVCKRNVPTHEVFAQKLAGNALLTLVEPLVFDLKEYPFQFFLLSDSTCGLYLFNPALNIKITTRLHKVGTS